MIMIWDFRCKYIYRKNQKKLYFFILENIELLYKMEYTPSNEEKKIGPTNKVAEQTNKVAEPKNKDNDKGYLEEKKGGKSRRRTKRSKKRRLKKKKTVKKRKHK